MAPQRKKATTARRANRKRQTTLGFDSIPTSSSPSGGRITRQTVTSSPTTTKSAVIPALPTPRPTRSSQQDNSISSPFQSTPIQRSGNFEVVIITPSKKPRVDLTPESSEEVPSTTKLPPPKLPSLHSDEDEDDDDVIWPSSRRKSLKEKGAGAMLSDPLLIESGLDGPKSSQQTPQSSRPLGLGAGLRLGKGLEFFGKTPKTIGKRSVIEQEESDTDEDVITPARKRIRDLEPTKIINLINSDDEIEDIPLPRLNKSKQKVVGLSDKEEEKEDEEGDDIPVSSVRRSRKKSTHNIQKGSLLDLDDSDSDNNNEPNEEVDRKKESNEPDDLDDLDEDMQLALKTPTVNSRTRYSNSSPKLTPFQRKLQFLNAARAKKAGKEFEFKSEQENTKRALYDTDEESESGSPKAGGLDFSGGEVEGEGEGNDDEEDVDDESEDPGFDTNLDDELSDFIVEDDGANDLLGAPEIPIEFTAASHQDLETSFKVYTSWLLLTILLKHPPEQSEFVHACLRRLQSQIDAYGASVLQSSTWDLGMLRAMKARPEFFWEVCGPVDKCDACHRSHRHAEQMVQFRGTRYDPVTLKDLDSDSQESCSEDSIGNEVPPEDVWYHLGRHCFARAKMRHTFFHWKKDLRNHVAGVLVEKGIVKQDEALTDSMVSESQDMDDDQLDTWAQNIVDGMQDQLNGLYHSFKTALDEAEINMTQQKSGKWRFSKAGFEGGLMG